MQKDIIERGDMEDLTLSVVLDIAIISEDEAYDFYMEMYDKIEDKTVKKAIEWIAGEEQKHKAFLVNYRDGQYGSDALRLSDIVNHNIAEHHEEPEIDKDISRDNLFLVASHKELRSYNFYTALAEIHPEGETKAMLLKIANEELRHKTKMESLYLESKPD